MTTDAGRFSYSRSKVETFKYEPGWELWFFTLDSPFYGKGFGDLLALSLWGDRVNPEMANVKAIALEIWTNRMWRHGDVAWAIFETILMAFLGTFAAAIVALPLSFIAARNFMPLGILRGTIRRIFDFVRGVDGLIWTIILSRAFGPGPMTGAIAIAITDAGSFGKTFSEALENIDEKQVEGIRSTGANAVQRARFGILPQVVPVLASQVLYFLESNTRGATVVGADAAPRNIPVAQLHAEHVLDRDLDLRLVRIRGHEERVLVLVEERVALLRDDRSEQDVTRIGDPHADTSDSVATALAPRPLTGPATKVSKEPLVKTTSSVTRTS